MALVTQVWDRLFVGSRADAENLFRDNPHNITTAISLCADKILHRRPGVNYLHLLIEDTAPAPVGQFDAIIDAIGENIRWGTVLIHCDFGVSSAPIMAAAWMCVCGCYANIDNAVLEIKKLRLGITPSSILLNSVREHIG